MSRRALVPAKPHPLVELLEQLPAGNYRAILTVTKIRRRGGYEVDNRMVLQQAVDLKLRRRRLTTSKRRKEIGT